MRKLALAVFLFLIFPIVALGQAQIPVSGSRIKNNVSQPFSGQLKFTVTDTSDNPVTYTPQGGSPTTATIIISVINGVVQNSGGFPPTIPNPATMSPANTRYRLELTKGPTLLYFPLINITTTNFSVDGFTVQLTQIASGAVLSANGHGMPQWPCGPGATYNDLDNAAPYPWVCSQLQSDNSIVWTQNPSVNPMCQKGNSQAIASPINGSTPPFCLASTLAWATPGLVYAGPTAVGVTPGQIGLVPVGQLCANGACGSAGNLNGPQDVVGSYAGPGVTPVIGPSGDTTEGTFVDHASKAKFWATKSVDSKQIGGVYNIRGYGAVPDGITCSPAIGSTCTYQGTDNAPMIQAAINDACLAGGGTIYAPGGLGTGIYNMVVDGGSPRQSGVVTSHIAAITIPCSNITFASDSESIATLSVFMRIGSTITRAMDACPVNTDFNKNYVRCWRGSGIYIVGSTDSAHPTQNILFRDIALEGNNMITGNGFSPTRGDTTVPLPFWSQANGFDTSNKGIYLQNVSAFGPNQPDGAYYPGGAFYFKNIRLLRVRIKGFLAEELYAGNAVHGMRVNDSQLSDTNGDCISVAGGGDYEHNTFTNCWAQAIENPVTDEDMTIFNNQFTGGYIGIALPPSAYWSQNPQFPNVIIDDNLFQNIIGQGMLLYNPQKYSVKKNRLVDVAYRGNGADSSAGINLYGIATGVPQPWGPDPPAAPATSVATGTGGSVGSGTYQVATTWFTQNSSVFGETGGSCSTVVVGSSGSTITVTQPASPPTGTVGWFSYAVIGNSTHCHPDGVTVPASQGPALQNGNNYIPISQTTSDIKTIAATSPQVPLMNQPVNPTSLNGFVVYPPNPIDVDVQNNTVTSDQASISVGIACCGAPGAKTPVVLRSVNLANNKFAHLNTHTNDAHAAPTVAPNVLVETLSVTIALGGSNPQPFIAAGNKCVQVTLLYPSGETPPSPEVCTSTASGQQLDVWPVDTAGAPIFKVYVSAVSGQEILQDNNASSTTTSGSHFLAQYTLRTAADGGGFTPPPTAAVTGTTFKVGMGFPTAFSFAGNSTKSLQSTYSNNPATGTLTGAVEQMAVIDYVMNVVKTPTNLVSFTPVVQEEFEGSLTFVVTGTNTPVDARVTYRAPDGSFPTIQLTDPVFSPENVTPVAWTANPGGITYRFPIPPFVATNGFPINIVVDVGVVGTVKFSAQINEKGVN